MRCERACAWALAGVVSFAPHAYAQKEGGVVGSRLGGPDSISHLAREADAIVVATSDPPVPGQPFILSVERVVTGNGVGPALAAFPPEELDQERHPLPLHGLWFLKREGHRWTVLPPLQGSSRPGAFLIAGPPGDLPEAYRYAPDDSPADKLVQELRAAVEARADGLVDLMVYDQLFHFVFPRQGLACARAVASSSHRGRCAAVRLAREWDTVAARRVAALVSSGYPVAPRFLEQVSRLNDPAAVPALEQTLDVVGVGPGDVQESVARALRNIHDAASVPLLARLLDSPSRTIEYYGVSGLALFAKSAPRGGPDDVDRDPLRLIDAGSDRHLFDGNPELYVENWKSWWAAYKSRQAAGPARP